MTATERLAKLLPTFEGRRGRPTREELKELPGLYRRAVSELAEARARGGLRTQLVDAEALVVRAHAVLYAPQPGGAGGSVLSLLSAFPRAVRKDRHWVLIAFGLLFGGVLWGWAEVRRDPSSAAVLLSSSLAENAEGSFQEGKSAREGDPLYGPLYFTHNTQVAFTSYALGATFGVGTAALMFSNGVAVGATFAVVESVGSPRAFLSFVSPHAGVELTAIAIAAAGGLRLGMAMLRPGPRRRRDALGAAARETLPLALGSALLLLLAGMVEGWLSPMPWPLSMKVAFGLGLDALLYLYLRYGQRGRTVTGGPDAGREL